MTVARFRDTLFTVHLPYRSPRPVVCCVLTICLGPAEIAECGHGAPVLIPHGTLGGVDAAEAMPRFLSRDPTRAIRGSRLRYLGTSLASGTTIDEQADLMIAVLDALDITSASVFCLSGSGPCGYRLVVLHPDRIAAVAVLAVSALGGPYRESSDTPWDGCSCIRRWGSRCWMGHRHPADLVRNALDNKGELTDAILNAQVRSVRADQQQFVTLRDLALASVDCGDHRSSYCDEMHQLELTSFLAPEKLSVPVLVVHGDVDIDAPTAHADRACTEVPGCERLALTKGGHLAFYAHPDAPAAQQHITNFLLRHTT